MARSKSKKESRLKKILPILSYLTWVVISFLIANFITILINTVVKFISADLLTNNTYKSIIAIVFDALFLIIIFAPQKIQKKPLPSKEELGLNGWPTWTDILLAIVGFFAYILLSAILTKLFEFFPFFDSTQEQKVMYDFLTLGSDRIFAYLAMAILPPIAEEIIFRGWLYQKLRTKISGKKSRIISILIVSIFFAIMHGQWNVGVSMFSLGIILCLIRELTGTIYGSILLHIIVNVVAFLLLFVFNS